MHLECTIKFSDDLIILSHLDVMRITNKKEKDNIVRECFPNFQTILMVIFETYQSVS